MEKEKTIRDIQKDLKMAKILSLFEGVCFFMAGICALLAGSVMGYISGGLLIAIGSANICPVFVGGDNYWVNLGLSLSEDDDVIKYGERMEEVKRNENEGA